LDWVKSLVTYEKYQAFARMFRFPISTNELCEQIFGELNRVFDGRNPYFDYQFTNPEAQDDWEYYRNDVLEEKSKLETTGFETFKNAINSIVIVDLPQEQQSERPEPYFYFLDISTVVDFEYSDKFEWIIFETEEKTYAVFDDTYYSVYNKPGTDGLLSEPLTQVEHGLGYCPAHYFWTDALNGKNFHIKKSPLSNQLSDLDYLLFLEISRRQADLYAAYPITWGYEPDCDYKSDSGEYCEDGFLRNASGSYLISRSTGELHTCPVCSGKRLLNGAGSFVSVPTPGRMDMDGNQQDDMRDPVGVITYPVDTLNYNKDKIRQLRKQIYDNVVGVNSEVLKQQAINEDQVALSYESKTNVLLRIKRNFEIAQKWIDETICRLRYGDVFVNATVNWGTQFYIMTVSDLQEMYKQAKENGISESQLDQIANQIIETENRNNPTELQRAMILKDLEPYRHETKEELLKLFDKNLVNEIDFIIKINFANFVSKFEREFINIIEYGINAPYATKINNIKQTFESYARDLRQPERRDTEPVNQTV
jgi:hypothetical protein